MSPNEVFIVHSDGSYCRQEYPSAATARYHALLVCRTNPTAGVRVGSEVLRECQPVELNEAAKVFDRNGVKQ